MKLVTKGLLGFGAFFLVTAGAVASISAIERGQCTAGNQAACDRIEARKKRAEERQTRQFTEFAKRQAERQERSAQPKLWQPTPSGISMLALSCEQKIKPILKDPGSFRRLDEGMSKLTDTHVTVFVRYTATNSFGGRVQDVRTCTYTR